MEFLRNCWQAIAFGHEVGDEIVARRVNDEAVILFRLADGTVTALADRCAHRALPLSLGRRVGDTIVCGYHGMRYNADGGCIAVPGQDTIPARAVVRRYPLCERHTLVWIWMGDPAKADPALVPDLRWFDDPAWTCVSGYHHLHADYRLVTDNLLDLSHESYVHTDTIGNTAVADSPVTAAIVEDRYVRVHRFMADCEAPPLYARTTGFTRIDRWHTTYFTPPGALVIENGSKPAGSTDPAMRRERRILNLITPETASSAHYFWGVARAFDRDDRELDEFLLGEIYRTFDQDKVILEAQQRMLGVDPPDAFPVTIKVDAGPIQGRRLLATMLERERNGEPLPALELVGTVP